MNTTDGFMSTDWVASGELRWFAPYRNYSGVLVHEHGKKILQQKWTRQVTKTIESEVELYAGMTINETEVEWRDIPVVEEV